MAGLQDKGRDKRVYWRCCMYNYIPSWGNKRIPNHSRIKPRVRFNSLHPCLRYKWIDYTYLDWYPIVYVVCLWYCLNQWNFQDVLTKFNIWREILKSKDFTTTRSKRKYEKCSLVVVKALVLTEWPSKTRDYQEMRVLSILANKHGKIGDDQTHNI